jgi:hypothetical protein
MGSHNTSVSATSQQKRDLTDVSGSMSDQMRTSQVDTGLMDAIPRKLRMVEEALGGRPIIEVIIQICNGMHGLGAYLKNNTGPAGSVKIVP